MSVPLEVWYQIALNLPYKGVIAYCLTHKEYSYLCNDPFFWKQKALQDFAVDPSRFEYQRS